MAEPELTAAHRTIREAAKKLEDSGVDPGSIVDALLVLGINSGICVSSKEHMADWLKKVAAEVRAGRPIGSTRTATNPLFRRTTCTTRSEIRWYAGGSAMRVAKSTTY
jgi:hypothetical protein